MIVRLLLQHATACAATILSLSLTGCKCSATASWETDSETMTDSDTTTGYDTTTDSDRPTDQGRRPSEGPLPPYPGVIPAEASPLPANIPTFLADFCLVRFLRDAQLATKSGKDFAPIEKGEVRVLSEWLDDAFVVDITAYGAHEYQVIEDERGVPFESNCSQGQTVAHSAVFVDSVVYRSDRFEDELCRLERAATARETQSPFYSIGQGVFQFALGGFAQGCQESERGFIRLQDRSTRDERKLRPVHRVLAPR